MGWKDAATTITPTATYTNPTRTPKVVTTPRSTTAPTNKPASNNSTSSQTSSTQNAAALQDKLNQIAQKGACEKVYNDNLYTYQTGVLNLATQLSNSETEVYNEGTQQGWAFSAALSTINNDIADTNKYLTSDWNIAMQGEKPANGCDGASNIPSLLLVPTCNAADYGGIVDCIKQISSATAKV